VDNVRYFRVHFADEKLAAAFEKLSSGTSEEKELFIFLRRAFDDITKNPFGCIRIQQRKWPKDYVKKYGVTNLWKYDLPNGWRLIYTVTETKIEIISLVLEWFSHKEYERRFNY
jgi:hypothetical protein